MGLVGDDDGLGVRHSVTPFTRTDRESSAVLATASTRRVKVRAVHGHGHVVAEHRRHPPLVAGCSNHIDRGRLEFGEQQVESTSCGGHLGAKQRAVREVGAGSHDLAAVLRLQVRDQRRQDRRGRGASRRRRAVRRPARWERGETSSRRRAGRAALDRDRIANGRHVGRRRDGLLGRGDDRKVGPGETVRSEVVAHVGLAPAGADDQHGRVGRHRRVSPSRSPRG